jgi:CheY-like chemotaxis protein
VPNAHDRLVDSKGKEPLTKPTVLVVEDNDDIRELVSLVLTTEGYQVREAQHGKEALDILDAMGEQPCLVLLDMMMPVMDGFAFLQSLRKQHKLLSMPVVVVTASATNPVDGAVKTVRKPVSAELLRQLVREFC